MGQAGQSAPRLREGGRVDGWGAQLLAPHPRRPRHRPEGLREPDRREYRAVSESESFKTVIDILLYSYFSRFFVG